MGIGIRWLGNGIGYGVILVVVAFFKELFGSGTLLGFEIFGSQGKTLADIYRIVCNGL